MAILNFFRMMRYIDAMLRKAFSRDGVSLWMALIASILIGAVVFSLTTRYYEESAQKRFEAEAEENADGLVQRIEKYENALRSGVAFFQGSQKITREDWHRFIWTLQLKKYYPGVQGIGYSMMLNPEDVVPAVRHIRSEGFPSFRLKPEGKRDLYSTIVYLEPMDKRNVQAIGYDMYSEPVRRFAMQKARDTALPVISGKVTLVQEIDSDVQPGFLMYLPFYKTGAAVDTLEERRKSLAGFVYSPFRMKDLTEALHLHDSYLNYEIYDGKKADENLLYRSYKSAESPSLYHYHKPINVGGRTWNIYYASTEKFDAANASGQHVFLSLGIFVIYLLLVSIIFKLLVNRTALNRKKDELQKEKETAQNYLDIVDVIILVCDVDLTIRLINRYGCEVVGYSADDAIGKNWTDDFLSPAIRDEANKVVKRLLESGGSIFYENTIMTKNGEERLVAWRIRVLFDKNNCASGFLCSGEEITQIRKAQIRLNESEAFYRTIFSSVSEAIFILHDERIVDCNDSASDLFEMGKEEIIGKNIFDITHTIECRNRTFHSYLTAAFGGEYSTIECTLTLNRKDEEPKILEFTLSGLGNRNENKIIMIVRDIGRRVEEERLLKMHTRQAQMGEMISVIAHQWRQPLAIINAITAQMRLKLMTVEGGDPLFIDKLIMIEEQSAHLSQTISEYRDFFHPNKPKEYFQLSTVLNHAIHLVDYALKNHSIRVEIAINDDPTIFSYRNEILQVLIALLKNSLDGFEEHSIQHKKILITVNNENEYAIIVITDNAGGISPEIVDKIFLPYFTSKNQNNGTGLGLYMSKMIIEGHCHGVIHARSQDNDTVFTIKLPLENEE